MEQELAALAKRLRIELLTRVLVEADWMKLAEDSRLQIAMVEMREYVARSNGSRCPATIHIYPEATRGIVANKVGGM